MKEKNTKTKNGRSERAASNIVLCFFAAFNVCFFLPTDIFLANAPEIAFPLKPLMIFMGLVTAAVFAVLFSACMLTRGKANGIVRAAVFGVAAGFYIQGNFLAANMGVLDGSRYELPAWKAALNLAIWLVILAAPFFILIKFPKIFDNVVSYIPAAVIVIQVLALGMSAYMNLDKYNYFVKEEIFEGDTRWLCTAADLDLYSTNKNLIVIVADEYDSYAFDSAIEDEPESVSEFDGFTYYTNTTGRYILTLPSFAYILAAEKNKETFDAYSDRTFFETVSENYNAKFYGDPDIPPASMLSEYSDNFILKKITLADTSGYAGGMYKIALFRCMPELLKPLFWSSGDIGHELDSKMTKNLDLTNGVPVYSYENLDFYKTMPRKFRNTDENVFKLLFIFGLHDPRGDTRELERAPDGEEIPFEEEAVAVNKVINEYLKTLKDNGVYDNSEIIIMADHGHYEGRKYPLLMYKPADQTETGIKTSYAPISYDEMFPTLVMLAGGEPDGRTIFDIGEDEERVRYFGKNDEEITETAKPQRGE